MKTRLRQFLVICGAVIAATQLRAQVVTETFKNATADGWVFAGTGFTPTLTSGSIDPVGDGWLRLTSNSNQQATSAYYDTAFVSANRSVYASFDFASWGGTGSDGADGIAFFLFDGAVPFQVGATGGSLGYAQKGPGTDAPSDGLAGGYVGVAIDEYGNFSNPTEGRIGGPGRVPNSISVRGPGQGQDGYEYLGGIADPLSSSLDFNGATSRPDQLGADFRHIEISITATNQLSVSYQAGAANPLETILQLDLSGYERPETLKFGFSSGTGGLNNIHEVRNLNIATVASNMWDGGAGNGQWGSATNWNPDFLPASGSEILLNNTFVSTAQAIDVGTTRTVRSVTIDAPFSYTLSNGTLEFDSGGIGGLNGIFVTQANGVAAANTIGSALSLNNDIYVRNQTTGTLNLTGAVATNGRMMAVDGTGTTVASGVISGTGSIAKSQTGTLTLSGANTYSGGTTISGGTLNADHNTALGTGGVTLAGGTLASTTGRTVTNAIALTANSSVSNITTSGTLTQTGGNYTLGMNNATHSGGIHLSNNSTSRTLTVQVDSGDSTISGVIAANGGGSTAGSLTKTGSGNLILSGANTYTGTTTISAGSLTLGASNSLADTSSVSIGASGRLDLNGFSEKVGTLTAAGGATLDFGTPGSANVFVFGSYIAPPSGVLVVNNWESSIDKLGTTAAITNADAIYISGHGVAQRAGSTTSMGGSYGNAYLLTPVATTGIVWDGSSSTAWNTNANWTPSGKPASDEVAVFNNVGAGRTSVVLNGNNTIAGVRFDSNAPAYTITASGNRTLTLNGAVPYIQQQSAANQAMNFTTLALGNNTVVDITGAGNLSIGARITGTNRALIKDGIGAGKLILSGNNTFSGGMFINNGIVQTRSSTGLGSGTTTIADGAALEVANNISENNAISVSGTGVGGTGAIRSVANTNTLSGTITANGATTIAADSGSTLNLTGTLTGTNRDLTFAGAGNIAVGRITTGTGSVTIDSTGTTTFNSGNANTYSGETTVNSGTLALGKTAGINAIAGNLTINAGGTVRLDANNQILDTRSVTLDGGTFNVNGRTETVASISSGNTSSSVTLGAGALTINNTAGATYAGAMSGSGSLTKTGTGKLSLSGNGSGRTGTTNLNAGILNISGSDSVLGSGTVNVSSGSNLEVQGGLTLTNALTLSGTGTTANDGAIQSVAGANTFTGAVTLAANTRLQADASSTLTLSNNITGAARSLTVGGAGDTFLNGAIGTTTGTLTKDGSGILTLGGTNTYTGLTNVTAGTVRATNSAAFGSLTGGAVNISSGATLDIGANPVANNTNFGVKQFNIAGSGVGGAGAIVNSSLLQQNNAFRNVALTANATIGGTSRFDLRGGTPVLDLNDFTLTKTGSNQVSVVAGTITTGNINVQQGTFGIHTSTTATGSGTITYGAATTASFWGNTGTVTRAMAFNGATIFNESGTSTIGSNITFGGDNVANIAGTSLTLNGNIGQTGGARSLTKTGTGTLILGGTNSYTGATNINAGTLRAASTSALSSSTAVTVASGATLDLNNNSLSVGSLAGAGNVTLGSGTLSTNAGTSPFSGVISGTGGLTKTGAGTLTLSGANTYTGATTISAGTLQLGASNVLSNSTAVTVAGGATLNVNGQTDTIGSLAGAGTLALGSGTLITGNASNTTFTGGITGTGTLEKQGSGTFTIGSNINFNGDIDLNAGTLAFTGAAPIVAGTLTLSGGTLSLNASTLNVDTLYIAGNTVIDFGGPSASVLNVTNFELAAGVQLTINNWNNMVDYFFAQNWVGATQDVRDAAPMNQVTFTGNPASFTGWTSFQDEITPAPEPSTYGAILMGLSVLGLAWRRFAKKHA